MSLKPKFNLRELAESKEEDVLRWRGHRVLCTVVDDEGNEKETDTYNLLLSWHSLIVHRNFQSKYPLPYLNEEIVDCEVYNDKSLQAPINKYLKRLMPENQDPLTVDHIRRLIFTWQIKLNNLLILMTETYAVSATAECIVELLDHEFIIELKRRIIDNEITIDGAEKEFSDWIKTDDSINDNVFVMLSRTGGVSINQGYQTLVVRGAVFDLNNSILPNPILTGYAEGIVNQTDSLGDSRGLGMSLISNGAGLQSSEWFHRKGRTYAGVIHGIKPNHDCGSSTYIPVKVESYDLLMALQGKYIKHSLEDEEEKLATVKELRKVEMFSTLWLRDPAFCLSEDPTEPCHRCYGAMATALPYNVMTKRYANVGSWSATAIIKDIGQGMLSTKHFLRNTTTRKFEVRATDKVVVNSDGNNVFLNEDRIAKGTELILDSGLIKELSDLRSLDNLEDVTDDKLTQFSNVNIKFLIDDPMAGGQTETQISVVTSISSRKAVMTPLMLEYVIKHGWEQVDKKFISIDMSKWNPKLALFKLTNTHENLNVLRKTIEEFLEFRGRNNQWMAQEVTPELYGKTLVELWNLINHKFKGHNIVHASILLFATTARDPGNLCYKVMNGREPKQFIGFSQCLYNRGVGTSFLYNSPQKQIGNPEWYLVKDRQDGVFESYWHHVVS